MEPAASADSTSSKVDSKSEDASDGANADDGASSTSPVAPDQPHPLSRSSHSVFKSGYLFISSKGIGWTSWKKRWFILTRTSLVFFRTDPNAPPQKGGEVNVTLGGIDLNSSGSVVVRADKKLLTVLFPDGRDGRAFTLKAETLEDLHEWKTSLENALSKAPTATLAMGQRGIFQDDVIEEVTAEECLEEQEDRERSSAVIGRPVLHALEEVDGTPSFLEKALRFIEDFGVRIEGILRQSADVEEVKRRVQEYEQGKDEFSPNEDAHVVADCIKHVLREMPCYPVPASCCSSLLEAFRSERTTRIRAMRSVILETFPDANRRLLQRILKMMRIVVSHKADNRMSTSAVAACMAPLLLRPLLAGDCPFDDDFHLNGDGSLQLLQAAAAANHAQAIIITLLEEYHNIFSSGDPLSVELYSASESCYTEDEEFTDDEYLEDDGYDDAENNSHTESENYDDDRSMSGSISERSEDEGNVHYRDKDVDVQDATGSDAEGKNKHLKGEVGPWPLPVKDFEIVELGTESATVVEHAYDNEKHLFEDQQYSLPQSDVEQKSDLNCQINKDSSISTIEVHDVSPILSAPLNPDLPVSPKSNSVSEELNSPASRLRKRSYSRKPSKKSYNGTIARRQATLGRTSARKNHSLESIELSDEDVVEIQKLETTKNDLQKKIAREADEVAILKTSLDQRKQALRDRRMALEQEVFRLQEQLQRERQFRTALEAGLYMPAEKCLSDFLDMDIKTRGDLQEVARAEADVSKLKEKVRDLNGQLNKQHQDKRLCESCSQNYSNSIIEASQNMEPKSARSSIDKKTTPQTEKDATNQDLSTFLANTTARKEYEGDYNGKNNRVTQANFLPSTKLTSATNTNTLKGTEPSIVSANKNVSQKQQTSGSAANVNNKPSTNSENATSKGKDQVTARRKGPLSYLSRENNSPKSAPRSGVVSSVEEKSSDVSNKTPVQTNASLSMEDVLKDTSTLSRKNKVTNTSSSNDDLAFTTPISSSKKTTGKNEAQNAPSALSRFTNRFNFRRERRSSSNEFPDACLLPQVEPPAPSRTNSR